MYLSHLEFLRKQLLKRGSLTTRVIEFGGSNGFIRKAFGDVQYEVAENAPVVDIHDLSEYPEEHYDFVVLDEILEHVRIPWVATKQIHRILKKGGCLITSSPFLIAEHKVPLDYWRFTKDGLRVLLEDFSRVEAFSWGNPNSVEYLMRGMMVTIEQAIQDNVFDQTNVEKFAISIWAYAWK
jgi:SAM-dependent methyltransferase